ncbi:MAG TPA: alpha/beta hydrolase domain-containing protein [Blastocatellia bacterium]|nr:alpha/beta hydrolase domain-containing protein [Blastocatellia bacterium]
MKIMRTVSLLLALAFLAVTAHAKVTRLEIISRADVAGGKTFGAAGPYEKIVGKLYFEVDPTAARNRQIVDLDKAPRNARGMVEFTADLFILRPKDASRGNGAALVEIPNRGGKALLRFFNHARSSPDPMSEEEMGDGFLLRQGFALVWVGWQFDVPDEPNLLRLIAPVATDNGKPIRGLVRADFVFSTRVYDTSLGHRGQKPYPALDLDDASYTLTVRDSILGGRRAVPRDQWQFARLVNGQPVSDASSLYLKGGFEPGKIYEVVYRAENPVVVGLGLAAVRDAVAFFKYDKNDALAVTRAIGFGISQSGRFLRHFLYDGFNADEGDRKVFDAIDAHVAGGGRGSFNYRFGEASRDASQYSTFFYPTDVFPFTDLEQRDPLTGERDGLLTHAKQQPLPKIFYTFSSYEYWGRAAALIHTTLDGKDAPLPDNVRIYYFVGGQHGPSPFPPRTNGTQNLTSPNDYTWAMRALIVALDRWARAGALPPVSRYPRLSDQTLARPEAVAFPKIPGINFTRAIHEAYRVDYGPQFKSRGIATLEPPKVGHAFVMYVPQVDRDGIDLGGVRLPEVAVPLATYTGWNPRDPKTGATDQLADFAGSFIPFAKTKAERERAGDPRLSIEERYGDREHYLAQIEQAANELIKGGYLLADDLPAVTDRAAQYWKGVVK